MLQHHHQHPSHQTTKPQIRVRNFPKEVDGGAGEETEKKHFALHYHERDRLIREHQHEQQIKRSRKEEQQDGALLLTTTSQPSFLEGCSNVVVNGGDNDGDEHKKNYHSNKVGGDYETGNFMYTNRNSSGQHNRFLMAVKGEFFFLFFSSSK